MRIRAVGLVAVLALVLVSCGGGTPEAAGPSEGIGVQGAWTIDVYNPDGTLDENHEFDNGLRVRGTELLAGLLTSTRLGATEDFNASDWAVVLADTGTLQAPGVSPCTTEVGGLNAFSSNPLVGQGCLLTMDGGVFDFFEALAPGSFPKNGALGLASSDGMTIQLSGSFVADQQGSIDWVESIVMIETDAPSGFPPAPVGEFFSFTGTVLTSVPVDAGQTVQVEIDISFGTLP